jgi:hypothetical protein
MGEKMGSALSKTRGSKGSTLKELGLSACRTKEVRDRLIFFMTQRALDGIRRRQAGQPSPYVWRKNMSAGTATRAPMARAGRDSR